MSIPAGDWPDRPRGDPVTTKLPHPPYCVCGPRGEDDWPPAQAGVRRRASMVGVGVLTTQAALGSRDSALRHP